MALLGSHMIGKRLTPQQREAYAALRARGVLPITLANGRVLHALKRQGRARFGRDARGDRVAWPRLTAAQKRAHARADRALLPYDVDPILAALAEQERNGIVSKTRVRRRAQSRYESMIAQGWIPPVE